MQRGAEHWLRGLAVEARARGWKVWAFASRGTTGLVLPSGYSSALRFAPAMELHELVALMEREERTAISVVLSASGPLVGNYLHAERGLHRVLGANAAGERGHFELSFVIAEAPPSPATLERVTPAVFDPSAALHLLPATRVVDLPRRMVAVFGEFLPIAGGDYWTEIDGVMAVSLRRDRKLDAAHARNLAHPLAGEGAS